MSRLKPRPTKAIYEKASSQIWDLKFVKTGTFVEPVKSTEDSFSPVTSHQSPVTSHQSPVTSHQSPVTSHQSPVTSHSSPRRGCSANYLDDLARDRRLPDLVHVQRQRVDHVGGVARRRFHGRHARSVLRGRAFRDHAV